MKTKHTPGPWFSEGSKIFSKQGAWYIAEANIGTLKTLSFTKKGLEAEANARLIAAAPDMLQFLEELEDQPGILHEDNITIKCLIRKAKGDV